MARYRITIDPLGAPTRFEVDGKPALVNALLKLGVSADYTRRPLDIGPVQTTVHNRFFEHHGKMIRWVALGNLVQSKPARPKAAPIPTGMELGGLVEHHGRRLSYWSAGPRPNTCWAVDVDTREYVLFSLTANTVTV